MKITSEISKDDAIALLKAAESKTEYVENRGTDFTGAPYDMSHWETAIKHDGKWWTLARTDLKDDICTNSIPFAGGDSAEHGRGMHVDRCIKTCRYGARFYEHDDGRRTFAVIDAYSDG